MSTARGGASQPGIHEHTEFTIGDSDNDGLPDIVTTTTKVTDGFFEWSNAGPQPPGFRNTTR